MHRGKIGCVSRESGLIFRVQDEIIPAVYLLTRTDNSHALSYGKDAMDAIRTRTAVVYRSSTRQFDGVNETWLVQTDRHEFYEWLFNAASYKGLTAAQVSTAPGR